MHEEGADHLKTNALSSAWHPLFLGNQHNLLAAVLVTFALLFLVGCSGSENSNANGDSAPTAVNPNTTSTRSATAPTQAASADTSGSEADSVADEAIWAAILDYMAHDVTIPYKDVELRVVSQDDGFATVEVHAQMRRTESDTWQEHVSTYKLKNLGGTWRVDSTTAFTSVLAPSMTATAIADLENEADLISISMLSANEGWAVGNVYLPFEGSYSVIWHYTSGEWEQVGKFDGTLSKIQMLSAQDGWAVGTDATRSAGVILHYTGNEWMEVEIPADTPPLMSIYMLGPEEGWAAGSFKGSLLHYSAEAGGKWMRAEVTAPDNSTAYSDIADIQLLSATEGWAVGSRDILHFVEGGWQKILVPRARNPRSYTSPADCKRLTGLHMVSNTEGWAVGAPDCPVGDDSSNMLHYQDGSWSHVDLEGVITHTMDLQDIEMVSPSEGWVVGGETGPSTSIGVILHYKDGEWSLVEDSLPAALNAIDMVSPDEGWVVGRQGLVLHYKDGTWARYEP